MPRSLLPALAAGAFALGGAAQADVVTFEQIPGASSADDMSPDGRFVVGSRNVGGTYLLDMVTDTMISLPTEAFAVSAVSDDGSVVLGDIPDPEGIGTEVAGIWSLGQGWTSLGALPDALGCPSRSNGYELSADGTVAVGLSWDGCNGRAFRWTAATGMVELAVLANGGNRASVVSADGAVIAGFAQGAFSRTPARWLANGAGGLLDPPVGDVVGEVQGMSDDGTVLLGNWNEQAFRWTAGGGMEVLGAGSSLPGWVGIATDIADNGTVVGFDINLGARQAWIQPLGRGPLVRLANYIEVNGGEVPAGVNLDVCQAISTDGRTIIGHGGTVGGWRVTIEPCADADGDGNVGFSDVLTVLTSWGTDGPGAELAEPYDVADFADLLAVLTSWGPCP